MSEKLKAIERVDQLDGGPRLLPRSVVSPKLRAMFPSPRLVQHDHPPLVRAAERGVPHRGGRRGGTGR